LKEKKDAGGEEQKKEKKVDEWRKLEATERIKHALVKGIIDYVE
jgi:cobalamin-dependent methionine synthase I